MEMYITGLESNQSNEHISQNNSNSVSALDFENLLTAKKFFPRFILIMLRKNHLNLNIKKLNAVKAASFARAKELNWSLFMLWRRGSQAVITSVFGSGALGSIPAIVSFR